MKIDKPFIPSIYQDAIFKEVQYGTGNLVVDSVPGSGKSKTIELAIGYVPEGLSVLAVAFNRHIAEAGKKKLPRRFPQAWMLTLHQLGLQAISRSYLCPSGKYPEVEEKKVYRILSEIIGEKYDDLTRDETNAYKQIAKRLISLYKDLLIPEVNEESMLQVIKKYNLYSETELDMKIMLQILTEGLHQCRIQIATIDYDDMIWYPIIYNLSMPYTYHMLFVDEAQDLSPDQTALILKALKPGGRIIAVGDTNQSIYAFRGADTEAIPNLIKILNAKVMPLSISYRCPKKHIEKLKKMVPQIESAPWVIDGEIKTITEKQIVENVKTGDMIICRYTAPLIPVAFKLLKSGMKVAIKGRDIEEGLVTIINDLKAQNMDEFYEKLREWKSSKQKKAIQSGSSPEQIHDKYDCLIALAEDCDNVECIKRKIYTIFADTNAPTVLSTIHGAKGLEADRVHILHPENMPSCYAKTKDELKQERNAEYIAYSRSKNIIFEVR